MSLIVVKLGGSVITYKKSYSPKPRITVIKSLSKEILSINKMGYKIILVHGGGSYGHNLAKKYNLTKGLKNKKSYTGFVKTVQSMNKLNHIILDIFEQIGIPALSLPPHSFITQTNGKLDDFEISIIKRTLDLGFIPILYGDPVIDKKLGCSILSGDTIATHLAKKLNAEKVIFLSDVHGVLDGDLVIKEINNENLDNILGKISLKNSQDITGGMKGKILSIKENLSGKKVSIINGLVYGNLTREILKGGMGTVLVFQ